jgi:hypothetical protein
MILGPVMRIRIRSDPKCFAISGFEINLEQNYTDKEKKFDKISQQNAQFKNAKFPFSEISS